MKKAILFFLLLTCIESCMTSENPIDRINKKLKINDTGALRKDIPAAYNDSSASWQYVRRETSRVRLQSIENGNDWPEIRIWEDYDWGRMVFVIRYKDGTWKAEDYIYRMLASPAGSEDDVDLIVVDTVRLGKPKAGWNKFMNKLIDKGILELRDKLSIPGYYVESEFSYIAVEVAAKNYYRYYSLPNAREITTQVKEDKAMLEILELIAHEFPDITSAIDKYSKAGLN
ncbi:MAG: hypothetical protein NTW29_18655 [Bacteroidetes bacterium]|nr:hypothetical protein [Bacteroidota bacterium]